MTTTTMRTQRIKKGQRAAKELQGVLEGAKRKIQLSLNPLLAGLWATTKRMGDLHLASSSNREEPEIILILVSFHLMPIATIHSFLTMTTRKAVKTQ